MPEFVSILFILSYLSAICAISLAPQSDEPQRALSRVPIAFFVLIGFDGAVAGICTLLNIPVALISQMCGHLLVIASAIVLALRKKKIQRLYVTKGDLVVLFLITAIAIIVVRMEFGSDFTPHYIVTDAINHFRRSLRIYFDGAVSGMFQAWNFIASAIGVSSAFVRFDMFYKVYLACDALFWYMGGLLFYATACELLRSEHREVISCIFASLYFLGYPLNSLIWGFCYLGLGISFSMLSLLFCQRLCRNKNSLDYAGLSVSLFAVLTSYALFAPFVFFAVFTCIIRALCADFQISITRQLLPVLALFILPGLLGTWFFYDDILSSGTVTISGAISNEGGMYRNLYSNLILFLPLIITSFWYILHNHRFFESGYALAFSVFAVGFIALLIPTYLHIVSTYYLGKLQFAIWPFALLLAARGAQEAMNLPGKVLLGSYSAVFAFLGIMVVGNVDQRVTEAYQPISVGTPAGYHPYLDVYQWNLNTMLTSGAISGDVWELCHEASDLVAEGQNVPAIAFGLYNGWYCDITCQLDDVRALRVSPDDPSKVVNQIVGDQYQYVTVITTPYGEQGDDGAATASNILLSEHDVEIVFQNSAGYIARLY